ncbi:MAG: hypothetical protein ACTSYB_08655 [Candidatus Helarchaeota archaeon]
MSSKLTEKALKHYQKGEKHLASGKYKKCESDFEKAIDYFMKAGSIERAEKVTLKLCECFLIEKKFYEAAKAAYNAAELILRHKKFPNAIKHYQSVIDFYEKVDATLEILEVYSLIALCHIAQGKFRDGIDLLKKKVMRSTLPQLKKNKLIQLTVLMVNTILKKDADSLKEIEYQITKTKVGEGIVVLFQTVQQIIDKYVNTIITITPSTEEIRAGDTVEITIEVKRPSTLEILKSELSYDRIFDLVEEKTITPDKRKIYFKLRPRIPGKLKIGPIELVCKVDEFQFPIRIQKLLTILPGKPKLVIEPEIQEIIATVGTPITITLNLKNTGKGECMNLHLKLSLPEKELELLEGGIEKKLHSLGAHEEFPFTFRITINDRINSKLSAILTYEDLEGNQYTMKMDPIPILVES